MRSLLRVGLVAAALLAAGRMCEAQISQLPSTSTPRSSTGRPSIPSIDGNDRDRDSDNPLAAIQAAQRVKSIANERQKKIVEGASRLLQLANELNETLAKTPQEKVPAEAIRKVEDIEKLARDVKQRTKG